MSSIGIDRNTGEVITGWDHVRQSLEVLISTAIGSRVERRDYGCDIEGLIDKPQNEETVVDFAIAIAEALEPRPFDNGRFLGEPRFQINRFTYDLETPGVVTAAIEGVYFPNGHLGDFSVAEDVGGQIRIR